MSTSTPGNYAVTAAIQNLTKTIDDLNYERCMFQLPVVVTMGVIMTLATLGNLLVIYVYAHKKMVPSYFFILLLAIGDLISSTLCIPFQMFDLTNPYKHPVPVACKLFRFTETVANIWCGLILMCIAFDRYFKICHPLQSYTMGRAKNLAMVMFAVTISLSWPQLFLVGKRTVQTSIAGVYGEDCSTQDGMFGSIYSLLFQGAISLTFGICMVIFLLFYGMIFHVVLRRKSQLIGERYSFRLSSASYNPSEGRDGKNKIHLSVIKMLSNSNNSRAFSLDNIQSNYIQEPPETICNLEGTKSMEYLKERRLPADDLTERDSQRVSNDSSVSSLPTLSPKSSNGHIHPARFSSRVKIRTSRTTLIFAMVTLAAVAGFLPYLILEVLRQSGAAFQPGMTKTEDLLYEFLSKSYFLNNIANPLIYSIMNPAFRKDSHIGMKKLFKC